MDTVEKIVNLSFNDPLKLNTVKIVFNDNSYVEILKLILTEHIPYFKAYFNSNFRDSNDNVIKLNDFTKREFEICVYFSIWPSYISNRNVSVFNDIYVELLLNPEDDIFIGHIKTLKSYYDKFEYLCLDEACDMINEIIENEQIYNRLIKLGNKNVYFNVEVENECDVVKHMIDIMDNYIKNNNMLSDDKINEIDMDYIKNFIKNKQLDNSQKQFMKYILDSKIKNAENDRELLINRKNLLEEISDKIKKYKNPNKICDQDLSKQIYQVFNDYGRVTQKMIEYIEKIMNDDTYLEKIDNIVLDKIIKKIDMECFRTQCTIHDIEDEIDDYNEYLLQL